MLLYYNEVYLRTQLEALTRYTPFYFGSRRLADVSLPEDRTLTVRESYRRVDRFLDPFVTRVGWRLERVKPLEAAGRCLAPGSVAGRLGQYAFQVHGMSPVLTNKLRSLGPSVLHAFTGVSGAHALPLARKLKIPLVVSFGGYDANATDDELRRWPMRGCVLLRRREEMKRNIALILTVSRFLRAKLVARGWPAEKIIVHHGGIDTTLFTPERAPRLADRAPIVFFAGRLIEVKGTSYLLRAMAAVQNEVPAAELVIAGAGPLRSVLEDEAGKLGIRARFLGPLAQDEIRSCLARAQVYCMPSIRASTGEEEGLSNALLEAMAAGVPVIGTDTGGIPEAIGDTGFLVPERDWSALASRITQLLTDSQLRERMGAAARARVVSHFDLHAQAARLEGFYDDVLREGRVEQRAVGSRTLPT
jgi:glycosyltransferase involved in cell wall biosynthesis